VSITPDTKNWTWVLERECPECGFVADSFPREGIGAIIRENAHAWQQHLARADVRTRPRADVWSPLEYGCHIRDVYRICAGRLDLMLNEVNPTFANWDQDETALDDAYEKQDPAQVAEALLEWAVRVADRFDGVAPAEWARTGQRSDGAGFTVETFGRYVIHDVTHHLVDV